MGLTLIAVSVVVSLGYVPSVPPKSSRSQPVLMLKLGVAATADGDRPGVGVSVRFHKTMTGSRPARDAPPE
jgi:hypothetical protein